MFKGLGITLLVLASFFIFSAPYAHFQKPGFKSLGTSELPHNFPLAVVWKTDTNEQICRAFWKNQLKKLERSVSSYSLVITAESSTLCQKSVETLKQTSRWPVMFEWENKIRWPYSRIDIDETDGSIIVFYTHDDDLHNESRYRVKNGQITEAEHRLFSGPGVAIRAMPYGLVTTLAFWLLVKVIRRRGRNRQLPP